MTMINKKGKTEMKTVIKDEKHHWVLVDLKKIQTKKIELLSDNNLTRCPNCQKIVHKGNYCEMCRFKFPK